MYFRLEGKERLHQVKNIFILSKLLNPPLWPNKAFNFRVKGFQVETVVKAISSFEAATKFLFCAQEIADFAERYNAENIGSIQPIEITDEASDYFYYNIVVVNNKPLIELDYVRKANLSSNATTLADHIAGDIADLVAGDFDTSVPQLHVDFERREIIDNALRQYFGFMSFRPLQRETIMATMSGKDVMTVVGTGGGKSLMYLLPAVISTKTTLVISPITSLVDDMLGRCHDLGISACKFTGEVPKHVRDSQLLNIETQKVVLGTPEIFKGGELNNTVLSMIGKDQIDRIVFDEAHTIITWGNSFRLIYRDVCEQFAKTSCPKLLLSATIPIRIESELKNIFCYLDVFRSSIFCKNLQLEVQERTSKFNDTLKNFILEREHDCGIVYCVLPKDVSTVHAELIKNEVNCVKYHGQLSEELKTNNFIKWMNGECKVIVANSSFGMGIEKEDVRYVIHARIPTSIEEYYQQCGRAGRDGLPAKCVLFYKYGDKSTLSKLFQSQSEQAQQVASVNELINFLEDPVQCRHKSLMLFFGETTANFLCGVSCDNCLQHGSFHMTDGTTDALKVLEAMLELTGRVFTCNILKLLLLGSRQKVIQEQGLDELSNFGILEKQFVPGVLLDKFLHSLINMGILAAVYQKKGRSSYLQLVLGPKAHDLMALRLSVSRYLK